MGKCKFKNDWLLKKDNNGFEISSWGKKYSDEELFCNICVCIINIKNKGFHSILQHSDTGRHIKLCRDKLKSNQLQLAIVPPQKSSNLTPTCSGNLVSPAFSLFSVKDTATVAELIWTMKSACCNYSAASCLNITETFAAMFPGDVSKHFSLSPKKMSYLLTDALQPYFHNTMLKDVSNSLCYTLCFDETTNVEDRKELQITIRYWSDSINEVVSKHLHTCFIGKADANTLQQKIISVINENSLPLQNLLMIGSDGPNVNKKVFRMLNEEILSIRTKGLINIGTCPLHTVHNAFLKGMQVIGNDAVELVIAIYNYFDGWPSRVEDYEKIQEELKLPSHKFLKHSSTRWLTFRAAAHRLIEQWKGINQYFFKFIPHLLVGIA